MREARRRRILENSEKRLQRILGVNTDLTGKLPKYKSFALDGIMYFV